MTNVYFKGGELYMGNGLICREPGVYETTEEFAHFLLENHADQFEAAPGQPAVEPEESHADEQEVAETAEQPETKDEEPITQTEGPEATQEPSRPTTPTKSLSKMNKTDLQAVAAENGVAVTEEMTADEMRAAIKNG